MVLENEAEHLFGNVLMRFSQPDEAVQFVTACAGRWFAQRPLRAELVGVRDFFGGRCKAYDESRCERGSTCNFGHFKKIETSLKHQVLPRAPRSPRDRGRDAAPPRRDERRSPRRDERRRSPPRTSRDARIASSRRDYSRDERSSSSRSSRDYPDRRDDRRGRDYERRDDRGGRRESSGGGRGFDAWDMARDNPYSRR